MARASTCFWFVVLAAAGCGRKAAPVPASQDSTAVAVVDAAQAEATTTTAAIATTDAGSGGSYEAQKPAKLKSIGHTSVVFRVVFADQRKVAFKPRSVRGKVRFKGEIAAYRLAKALGLDNVPVALPYRGRADEWRAAAGDDSVFAKEVVVEPTNVIRGALIPWLDKLDFPPLENEKERAKWEPWVFGDAVIPSEKDKALAADLSTLIAFDTMTGNWDRWSGANIGQSDASSGHILFVDNDGAFFDPVPSGPLERQKKLLSRVTRFSRSFVDKLRQTNDEALRHAFGEEFPGEPLLSEPVLRGVASRRSTVLSIIDAKVKQRGENAVLAFP